MSRIYAHIKGTEVFMLSI